jgi:serine phosphatase RsbU (regulator of sigma subunit)
MFPNSRVEIRADRGPLFAEQTLLHHPQGWPPVAASAWEWLRTTSEARSFVPGEPLPWRAASPPAGQAVVVAPILEIDSAKPLGGIYLSRNRDPGAVSNSLPAVQSLAAQIASALNSNQVYAQTLAHQRVEQELALAGKIQTSFLPEELPHIPGWQLAAALEPARETSGDFYDVIPLSNGHYGLVVADVADKGMGASLYMALSRTLIRTYAAEYESQPDLVLAATNRRILMDARARLFVTAFYGVLDPAAGILTYCIAGHHPPYLLSSVERDYGQELSGTGMALGVLEEAAYEYKVVQFDPGAVLLLYTDGVIDARNAQEEFFGQKRMLESARAGLDFASPQGHLAQEVQDILMARVHEYVGDASQFDDITVMVLSRDSAADETKQEVVQKQLPSFVRYN